MVPPTTKISDLFAVVRKNTERDMDMRLSVSPTGNILYAYL